MFCFSVREFVVIEESEWCPAGIIKHFEKFKMASNMATMSWVQDGMPHIGIYIQQSIYFLNKIIKQMNNKNF